MYSLFIDTHDRDLVIGLYKDGKIYDSDIKASLRNHSDFTMPMIDNILKVNNLTVHDLSEILVINGPGSFTGVRIGVTIAKMLAYTLNIPIKSITSLEMYAVSNNTNQNKLVIIRDVKGVFGALFNQDNEILENYFYKANDDFKTYVEANNYNDILIEDSQIDYDALYEYSKKINPTPAHAVNPLYIKVIEALKHD